MSSCGLSNGGRSIILETLKEYKNAKILMISDYEATVKAISDIPVAAPYTWMEEDQTKNQKLQSAKLNECKVE
jgi:hypothetical protein